MQHAMFIVPDTSTCICVDDGKLGHRTYSFDNKLLHSSTSKMANDPAEVS